MTVIPIKHPNLTAADIHVLKDSGEELVNSGRCGACCLIELDDGDPLIAFTDAADEALVAAIGKSSGWYYVLDADWLIVAKSRFLQEILTALPELLSVERHPSAQIG